MTNKKINENIHKNGRKKNEMKTNEMLDRLSVLWFAGLLHNDNLQKMRLLTLMLMAEDQQQIDFTTMQRELQLPADEIEAFVIDGERTPYPLPSPPPL